MRPSDRIVQHIRKIAKRGTNAKLLEALNKIYLAGMEEGMKALSNQLKERLNDIQGTDTSIDSNGEREESNSEESTERSGLDANDLDSSAGSTESV